MKRSVLCLCVIVLLVVFSVPSFAASGPAFKVGVVFTSDTLDIPDSLSDLVTGLFSNALSRFTNISIVNHNSSCFFLIPEHVIDNFKMIFISKNRSEPSHD